MLYLSEAGGNITAPEDTIGEEAGATDDTDFDKSISVGIYTLNWIIQPYYIGKLQIF